MRRFYLAILILILSAGSNFAGELILKGKIAPGNLVWAKAENAKWVFFNDKQLSIDEEGNFIFGFDRDAKGEYLLRVKYNDGSVKIKKLKLADRKYKIQRINNMKRKYVSPPKAELEQIKKERKIKNDVKSKIGEIQEAYYKTGFARPVKGGRISGIFGSQRILNGVPKNAHNGLDIAARRGTPVHAMADGVVKLAADEFYYSGNFLLIEHGQGLYSVYLHLSKKDVKDGDIVKKGQKIGEIGTTGRSTGPHLHWGVNWYKNRIDPACLLELK